MNAFILIAEHKNFSYKCFDIVGVYTDHQRLEEDKTSLELSDRNHDIVYYVKTAPLVDEEK